MGDDKARLLESSELFVFPTLSENFGIVVAEALSYGLPVIASTGSPWAEIATRGCGWWIDPSVDSLAAALDDALSERPRTTCDARCRSGRTWMEDAYSWHVRRQPDLSVLLLAPRRRDRAAEFVHV